MKKNLSVIVPNYNNEKYIEQCIQSILEQTYIPDEIIIVDDHSTDNSVSIIDRIVRENCIVKSILLPENQGVSHARNIGLAAAQSEYVSFIDSDDYYYNKNKLQNEMSIIENNDGRVIAYSKVYFVLEDGEKSGVILPNNRKYLQGRIYNRLLTERFRMETLARDYCVKKDFLLSVGGYNEERNLYEDLELMLKLAEKYEYRCTGEFGTAYRQTPHGLSKKSKEEHLQAKKEIFENQLKGKKRCYQLYLRMMRCEHVIVEEMQQLMYRMKDIVKRIIRW